MQFVALLVAKFLFGLIFGLLLVVPILILSFPVIAVLAIFDEERYAAAIGYRLKRVAEYTFEIGGYIGAGWP